MLDSLLRPNFATYLQRPGALGRVFYVHGFNGNNANSGQDPSAPLQTITYALTLCANDRNDYILVMDAWQEAMPIHIDVSTVHIIGIGSNPGRPFVCLNAALDTAIFDIDPAGDMVEIAGFCLGGGATASAIDVSHGGPFGAYIHHNIFGHPDAGNTPRDGIFLNANMNSGRISNNKFIGDGANCGGTITRNGIQLGGGPFLHSEIIDNIMMGLDICINVVNGDGMVIANNILSPNANTAGGGITLGAGCAGCFVARNSTNFGDTAMAANPYTDGAAAGANHWVDNRNAGVAAGTPWILPA